MLAEEFSPAIIQRVREQKADDVFDEDFTEGDLVRRLEFLLRKKCDGSNQPQPHTPIFEHNFTSLCPNYQQKGLDVSQQPLFFDGRGGLRADALTPFFFLHLAWRSKGNTL